MVEPRQRPSAGAMGHHSRCFARNISSPKGAIKKNERNGSKCCHFKWECSSLFEVIFWHYLNLNSTCILNSWDWELLWESRFLTAWPDSESCDRIICNHGLILLLYFIGFLTIMLYFLVDIAWKDITHLNKQSYNYSHADGLMPMHLLTAVNAFG